MLAVTAAQVPVIKISLMHNWNTSITTCKNRILTRNSMDVTRRTALNLPM